MDGFALHSSIQYEWDDDQAKIRQREIPRQAIIFRSARIAVAWLNDVPHWGHTDASMTWLGLDYIGSTGGCTSHTTLVEQILAFTKPLASIPAGFTTTGDLEGGGEELVGWLTSLWTLQETIMRPDIILLDRNWEPHLAGMKMPITLDSILNFLMIRFFTGDLEALRKIHMRRYQEKINFLMGLEGSDTCFLRLA